MGRFTSLKQFLGQFIKLKPSKENDEFKAKQRKKQEEHKKHLEEQEYGKHDKHDKDDSIY